VFYRICDVNFFAVNSCFRKRLIQEVAGGADEWLASLRDCPVVRR
jgi:hypothetical protein